MSKAVEIIKIAIIHTVIANTVDTTEHTDAIRPTGVFTDIVCAIDLHTLSANNQATHLIIVGTNTTNIGSRINNISKKCKARCQTI